MHFNGKVSSINKYNDMKCVLLRIIKKFKINITEDELETLSTYLVHSNYYYFTYIYYYNSRIVIGIDNTNGDNAYLIYDSNYGITTFVESDAITDFTNKERTDFIYTNNGKMIIQTINDYNVSVFFDTKASRKIRIDKYRKAHFPKDLEPTDIFDFSDNPTDLYKLLSIQTKVNILKMQNSHLLEKGSVLNG